MSNVSYMGYLIHVTSRQVRGEWIMELCISKHTGDKVTEKKFYTNNTFKTEEEAIQNSINFARQIIDGKSDNCTVTDL